MPHFPEEPDVGPDAPAETPKRKARGVDPLSASHRRRMLKALTAAALARLRGDAGAEDGAP